MEVHVVDPTSIATFGRRRPAKAEGIDSEALLPVSPAYKRGEPAMVKAPFPEKEDRRRSAANARW
jgi:transposase